MWGYFEARLFSSWIFLETLFWIRRLVRVPGAPSHQSEALLWKQVSKLHRVSSWCQPARSDRVRILVFSELGPLFCVSVLVFCILVVRPRAADCAAIRRRLRIAAESMRVDRQLADGFLRESAAGLSLSPPAMCHMLPVNHRPGQGGGAVYFWPLPYLSLTFSSVNISSLDPLSSTG